MRCICSTRKGDQVINRYKVRLDSSEVTVCFIWITWFNGHCVDYGIMLQCTQSAWQLNIRKKMISKLRQGKRSCQCIWQWTAKTGIWTEPRVIDSIQ